LYKQEFKVLDKKLFKKINKFKLSNIEKKELKKNFKNANILVIGAAGSIGGHFVKDLGLFKFNKLYLVDKDENSLTELNRELIKNFKKKIIKTEFICLDLNLLNMNEFISKNKITHYLNFAAVKHVRSEENIHSVKYMFLTNSKNFLPIRLKKNKLRQIFSVSTDKSVKPSSFLGVSKFLMEQKLAMFKKQNKNIKVSTSRFANVSFSKGSILRSICENLNEKKSFGIPENIFRYFITHQEASNLCFKSLLKNNDGSIIIPNIQTLKKEYSIKELCIKICKIKKFKPIFKNSFKSNYKKNKVYIKTNKTKTFGQKTNENFFLEKDDIDINSKDSTIKSVKLVLLVNPEKILNKIFKYTTHSKLKNFFKDKINNFTFINKVIRLSNTL
jgi:FlaA1/EpsC-like NDP-sugar epimerase